MTDIARPHGPQRNAMETIGRKPWQTPRLIDLDDDGTASGRPFGIAMATENDKANWRYEGRSSDGQFLAEGS